MSVHADSLRVETKLVTLDLQVLETWRAKGVGQGDWHVAVLEWHRPVQPLASLVADLKEIAPGTEDRMFAKFIADLGHGQRRNLLLHELHAAAHAVPQLVVDGVVDARTHRKPSRHAEQAEAAGQDQEIPSRQPESDGPLLHAPSSSRIEYPTPRIVWMSLRFPGGSILARTCRTKTSSVLLSISRSLPHTDSISRSRVITRPWLRMSASTRMHSVRVSGTVEPFRVTK